MVYGNPRAEKHAFMRQRRLLTLAALVVLAGGVWSLLRGFIDPNDATLLQPLFQRIDDALTSFTFTIWHAAPPFDYHRPLVPTNWFAYICFSLFIVLIFARNKVWSAIDDHNEAERDVAKERLRERYRGR
ncbi:MAG: hypothetical protein JO083_08465 [Candidatus Eremiobacteraeota bacterium]|nr:hypothetical protein [Candidatus Eremiobacteraeota bacterium]MBV8367314.1 hypothetical protein [Candidatus Eremiobacteraeota bacterium]